MGGFTAALQRFGIGRLAAVLGVAAGGSNAQIGRDLFMSEATVKTHVSRLLDKLDAANRVQLAILAHDAGLTHR